MVNTVDLEKAEDFYKELLTYYNPDFGLAETDPLYDILVRPARLYKIPELLNAQTAALTNRSLLQTSQPTASYDELLANFFIPRNTGSVKTVTVKFVFPTNTVSGRIPRGTAISAGSGSFTVVSDVIVSPASYILDTQEPYKNKYYFEVVARSTAAGVYGDVVPGISASATIFRAAEATLISSVAGGSAPESNAEAYARGKKLISIRNWISPSSINSQLAELYPGLINTSLVVGFLEPEMVRDRAAVAIPKHVVRLYFSSKVGLSLSPTNCRFFYNNDTAVAYRPFSTVTVLPTSTNWVQDVSGAWYIDVEVVLFSISNAHGFKSDLPVGVNLITGAGSQPIANTLPSFLGARSLLADRDETGGSTLIHIGSHTDIYVRPEVQRLTFKLFVPPTSSGFVQFPEYVTPVLRVEEILDELGDQVQIYNLVIDDPLTRYTGKDTASLFVNPGLVGTTITVTVTCAPLVRTIQNYIDQGLNRVVDSSTIVRYYYPIFVSGIVQLSLESSSEGDVETTLRNALSAYFSSVGSGGSITVDRLYEVLRQAVPSIRQIVSLDLYGLQYFPDGSIVSNLDPTVVGIETDTVWGVTNRNCVFEMGDWEFVIIT